MADENQYVTQEQFGQLIDIMQGLTDKVAGAPAPAPAPQMKSPEPKPGPTLLARIAENDSTPIREAAREEIERVMQEKYSPYLAAQAQDAVGRNEQTFRQRIDSEFGDGTWDKHFRAPVATYLKDNPAAAGLENYYARAVSLVRGEKWSELRDLEKARDQAKAEAAAKAEADKRAADQRNYPYMLGKGVPTLSPDSEIEFDEKDQKFLDRYEENSGNKVDRQSWKNLLTAAAQDTAKSGTPYMRASLSSLREAMKPKETK